ncbi:alpha/beta hydrolase [Thalassococcus sp. S3]|nr:alpha/beta hydrolase [Thalassococcus sp. S3]
MLGQLHLNEGITEHFVDAGGIRTRYLEAGEGPVVVLIHGGGAGADSVGNWNAVIPRLSDAYRVIAMDMVGFGETDKPGDDFVYSQEARNTHLTAFLDALSLDHVILIGNSMGGATALGVAVAQPERVDKLVLMGSAGLVTEVHEGLAPVMNYDFTRHGMERLIRALTTEGFEISPDMVAYRHEMSVRDDTRQAYGATMSWIKQQGGLYYEEDFVRQVRVPTLVVNGKQDKVVPLANAYRFLELIEPSCGVILPHCGHWAMIEHPEQFAAVTRNFLES